jgi:hypothetical protein
MFQKTTALTLAEAVAGTSTVTTGNLKSALLFFYNAGPTPTKDSVFSNFTPSTVPGAATTTLNWGIPILENDGSATCVSNICPCIGSSTASVDAILGSLVVASDSVTLLMAEQFATPQQLSGQNTGFEYAVNYNTGAPSSNCEGTILS